MNVLRRTKVATLLFSLAGLLLSGYLTYSNYFGHSCHQNPLSWMVSCGGPKRVLIFGQPTCVYGFFMFLAVAIVALVGIRKVSSVGITKALLVLGLLGTAFSGSLAIYELWFLKIQFTGLPACVYGFVLYVGILMSSMIALRHIRLNSTASTS